MLLQFDLKRCRNSFSVFFGRRIDVRTVRVLLKQWLQTLLDEYMFFEMIKSLRFSFFSFLFCFSLCLCILNECDCDCVCVSRSLYSILYFMLCVIIWFYFIFTEAAISRSADYYYFYEIFFVVILCCCSGLKTSSRCN